MYIVVTAVVMRFIYIILYTGAYGANCSYRVHEIRIYLYVRI